MNNKIILILLAIFLMSFASATSSICYDYDDFSSEIFDTNKWEIRQDVEGQSFMGEYGLDSSLDNFHTQQNTIGDARTYLFPKHTFTTGDIIEYDFDVISKEGNYGQMVLLTGDQYIRIGIMGFSTTVQGYDELGLSHVKIEFQENNIHIERTYQNSELEAGLRLRLVDNDGNPVEIPDWFFNNNNTTTLIDNLPLTKANGNYQLYIGSFSGHNGKTHIDYDNFKLCTNQDVPLVPEFGLIIGTFTLLSAVGIFFFIRKK